MGRIGAEVAKRAMAFGMKVVAYDPFLTEARAKTLGVEIVALEDAFQRADYITTYAPYRRHQNIWLTKGFLI